MLRVTEQTMRRVLLCLGLTVASVFAAFPADDIQPCYEKSCVAPAKPSQVKRRPQLLPYENLPDPAAVVLASDKMARFTVLTEHLVRMEYAKVAGRFEDHLGVRRGQKKAS